MKMDPKKTAVVKDWPAPKDSGQLRSSVGMANYFRRFDKGYSNLLRPLNFLLRKAHELRWTESCQEAFVKAKHTLVSVPVLAQPDFSKPFEVVADACGFGIGTVLIGSTRAACHSPLEPLIFKAYQQHTFLVMLTAPNSVQVWQNALHSLGNTFASQVVSKVSLCMCRAICQACTELGAVSMTRNVCYW